MHIADLHVVVTVDDAGNVVGYPKGGGSSSPSYIRAFESEASAKRSAKRINWAPENVKVMRVTAMEAVE